MLYSKLQKLEMVLTQQHSYGKAMMLMQAWVLLTTSIKTNES